MFEGYTPLHMCTMQGDPATVRQLLTQKPDVNSRTAANGFTALHLCVSGSDSVARAEIIAMLHEAGANLELKTTDKGLTPLQLAAMRDKPICVKALIQCGANVNATEGVGATAMHAAAYFGHAEVARALLDAGANLQLADKLGNTPVSLAKAQGHAQVLEILTAGRKG